MTSTENTFSSNCAKGIRAATDGPAISGFGVSPAVAAWILVQMFRGHGHLQRPLVDFVLEPWTDPEWGQIDALDAPFARFLELLSATEDLGTLANHVNRAGFWSEDPSYGCPAQIPPIDPT